VNGVQRITYTETDTGRRNSGRTGMRATLGSGENVKTEDFIVVEKGGSLTSTDIVPANVRLTYLSTTSVQVDWDASADIGNGMVGYEVFRGSTLVSGGSPITPTTFQNTGLTANTAYTYTVKAVDTPGTRYASLTKGIFRDDLNRSSLIANSGWSSAGNWYLENNAAVMASFTPSDALTTASYGSLRATATIGTVDGFYGGSVAGIVFWSSGSNAYRFQSGGLYYNGNLMASASGASGNGTIRVEANAGTRTINIYENSTLIMTYVELDLTRSNSGKAGLTGYIYWDPEWEYDCQIGPPEMCAYSASADDFMVEEQ
jgi:hypothetical protein